MATNAVLVTGASGFIGRYVIDELLRHGRTVIAFDRRYAAKFAPSVEVTLGDVRDPTAVTEAMAQAGSWIHLAGVLGTQETIQNPVPATETNIVGGLNILEASAQYALPGINLSVANWPEDNTYSITKHTIERFCSMYRKYRNVPVGVVRGFNAYGPGQSIPSPFGTSKVRKMVPSFITRALRGHDLEVYGDGQQIVDMIYVTDLASAVVRALIFVEQGGESSITFEAGTGRQTTVLDVAHEVIEAVGRGRIRHLPLRLGETPGSRVSANYSTLRPLGMAPEQMKTLTDGISETVQYYRSALDIADGASAQADV